MNATMGFVELSTDEVVSKVGFAPAGGGGGIPHRAASARSCEDSSGAGHLRVWRHGLPDLVQCPLFPCASGCFPGSVCAPVRAGVKACWAAWLRSPELREEPRRPSA